MLNIARFAEKSAVCRSWCTLLFYICNYEYRMRLGIAKSEMGFPLVSALTFHYLCKLYVYDSCNIDEWKSLEFNEI